MSHTPGPFCVENVNSDRLHDICLAYHIPGAGNPILVATVFADEVADRPGDIGEDEAEDNARLFAAAPDLLSALEKCVRLLDDQYPLLADKLTALRDARAAIAKATTPPKEPA